MIRFTFLKDRWPLCESYHKLEVVTPRVERDQSGATAMMTKKKIQKKEQQTHLKYVRGKKASEK